MTDVTYVPQGRRTVKLSWAKLVVMTKAQRNRELLMLAQRDLANDPEVADLITKAKAQRKANHIARMQEVAASKKKRR